MKGLLTILSLILCINAIAQVNFSFTAIPLGTDFIRPGAGAHLWNNRDAPYGTIHIPVSGSPQESMDYYFRFTMTHFFTGAGSDSTINWSFYRARMVEAINKRQGVRMRVMSLCNNCAVGFNNLVSYDGGQNGYPEFLHDLMQTESPSDWFSTQGDQDTWVPNWNSPHFHRWIRKLSQQIKNYIDTASHNGYSFADALRIYDLGYYGSYSEQHSNTVVITNISEYPSGTGPTTAGLSAIVDAQTDIFGGGDYKIVIPFNAFDCEWLGHTRNPIAYGQYLLDHPDSIGWINDHIGANESYDHDYLEDNNRMGGSYNDKLMNRWKYSPTGGEPVGWGQPADRSAIPQYVIDYHKSWFGNGNLDHITNDFTTEANNVRLASRLAGYRLRLTGGFANVGASLVINLNWLNEGNAPPYENWTVRYLIRNGAGNTVSTLTSSFNPIYFQPSAAATTKTDAFGIPGIPAGVYGLFVKVIDPTGYRRPMPLAITPAQSDTSYFLGNITIPTGTSNLPPIANAGPNQSITSSSTTLNGSASTDPDGTISSYAWSMVDGPNSPNIVSATSVSTSVTGMIGGVYLFNLTVTDDDGATASDQVQITVQVNQPPVANAGPNQAITLPTSSVTVNGSASTDDIAVTGYLWSQFSGPSVANIVSPTSVSTTINTLIAGTYTFRLTVTDGSGLTGIDDMIVTVSSGNTAPVANAGPNQTITLPTSSVTLNGSGSTDNVGITAYLWTQVGGAAGPTIVSPTSVSTSVTGLAAGLYVFRLRVEDVEGLFSIDDIQITVLSAPNGAPVANAGPNVVLTLPTNFTQLNGTGSTDDVGIVTYLWTKESGPATFSLNAPNNAICNAESLQVGVYVFRLTVTDGSGLTDFDDVTVTVNAAANAAPIAVAGNNISITLPTTTTSFDGSASSDDNGIINILWTLVSKPVGAPDPVIGTPGSFTTNVSNLTTAGIYVFRLTVDDQQGLIGTDDISVTVNPAANNAPVAIIAGGAQSIQLPTNSVSLDGSGSTDDVAVTGYLWSQISGPATATISAPTSSTTNMNNLVEGVYFFQLQVSDAGGLTDTDIVQITVLAADPPDPPLSGNRSLFKTGVKFLPRIP